MKPRACCVVAHPDDETIFAGGTLAMLADEGFEVHIVSATRGEGGERGDPPLATREELGARRERELRCAAQALGAVAVHFLEYVDPTVGAEGQLFAYTEDLAGLSRRLARLLADLAPLLVITHGSNGEYGHPAHIVTHQGVLAAHRHLRGRGLEPYLYTFSAAIPGCADPVFNAADPADVVVDVTPWMRLKAAAAECHRTQHPLFFRYHPQANHVLDLLRTQEGFHRVHPPNGPDIPVLLRHRATWFTRG